MRLSVGDKGLTFGSSTRSGVCVAFRKPCAAWIHGGLLRRPGLTVTVERPEELIACLGG